MKKKSKVLKVTGIVLCVFFVLFAGLFVYAYFNGRSGLRHNQEANAGDIKVACVGDSITYGSQVSNWPKNHYPLLLDQLLGEGYAVHNYGLSGATLLSSADKPYTSTDVYTASVAFEPDVVVIMLGTNDSKTNNWTDAEDFRNQLITFISNYSELPSCPEIYLCTPCKAYSDGYTIQDAQVTIAAQVVREVAEQLNVPLIDIHALSEQHPEWFEKDGIHPNNDGAAAIAQEVYTALTSR